jgi:isocitrate dehydrogenase
MADTPEAFDVIVLPNLYGDILSDIAAQIAGSVGLAGSANIGDQCAMFEAIHGSAPRRAGQNLANPSGLLLGAVMMMVHIDQADVAELVHNAWLRTLEDGLHTYDIYKEGVSKEKLGTREFAAAVVARVGKKPEKFAPASYANAAKETTSRQSPSRPRAKKEYVGLDVFLDWTGGAATQLGPSLEALAGDLKLQSVSNRGVKVYPGDLPGFVYSDLWNCRFIGSQSGAAVTHAQTLALQQRITGAGFDVVKTEGLYTFDGERGYSLGQGE